MTPAAEHPERRGRGHGTIEVIHDPDTERTNLSGQLFGIESAVDRIAGRRMRRFEIQPCVRG